MGWRCSGAGTFPLPASELSHGSSAAAADVPWQARIIWVAHIIDTYDQYVDGSVQEREFVGSRLG